MPIITISRGSYSKGKEIAEKVAQELGCECIARKVLLEASDEFNISELKLIRAIHDAPSLLGRLSVEKKKYIAFVRKEILDHFKKDNVVYHGLAGHLFVKGISHVLKVRIIADMEDRVRLEMKREGISREKALHILQKDDEERRKWSQALYHLDTRDSGNYDLVLHLHKLTVNDAVDTICRTAKLAQFQATPESRRAIDDLALAAHAEAKLMVLAPDLQVSADDGKLFVKTEAPQFFVDKLTRDICESAKAIPGIREIKVDVTGQGAGSAG